MIISDSVGAMLISVYIIGAWIGQANRKFYFSLLFYFISKLIVNFRGQIKRLTGYTAKPQFLSQITVNQLIFCLLYFMNLLYSG